MKRTTWFSMVIASMLLFSPIAAVAYTLTDVAADADGFGYFSDGSGRTWADTSEFVGMDWQSQLNKALEKGLRVATLIEVTDLLEGSSGSTNMASYPAIAILSGATGNAYYVFGRTADIMQSDAAAHGGVYANMHMDSFFHDSAWYDDYRDQNLGMFAYKYEEGHSEGTEPTPEPATLSLMGIGIIGVAVFGRMRRK